MIRLPRLASFALLVLAAPLGAQKSRADSLRVDSLLARADAGRIQGAAAAKIWIVELSDFQCPYCKRWHDEVYPVIKRDYVDKGLVRLAYVQFPLSMHQHAQPAAIASMCAAEQGGDKFWTMHDKLFSTQDKWKDLPSAVVYFDSLAIATGVNVNRWRDCVRSGFMRRVVDADVARGINIGVRSTPMFFVGDQAIAGAMPVDTFRLYINRQLAKAGTKKP
jgi:protein-disulfide isomerase